MSELSENKILFWLSLSGMSTKKINSVLDIYSAFEIWEELERNIKLREFCGEQPYSKLIENKKASRLDGLIDKLASKNINVISCMDAVYPESLKQREVNPPIVLYCEGDTALLKSRCISIVGTRRCSRYGKDVAYQLAGDLAAAGFTIVSGLATGIDAYAHDAALEAKGKTIAVLGGGHFHMYPAVNAPLAKKITGAGGLIVSEYPPDFTPTKFSFPERNRIVSGLSIGVVVIEAGEKSGTLITADYALEQGREVYAVPGNVNSPRSYGTNMMIKQGNAMLITSAEDIYSDLSIKIPEISKKNTRPVLDIFEEKIYTLLLDEKRHFDELLIASGFSQGELTLALTGLELKGVVRKMPSNFFECKIIL